MQDEGGGADSSKATGGVLADVAPALAAQAAAIVQAAAAQAAAAHSSAHQPEEPVETGSKGKGKAKAKARGGSQPPVKRRRGA